MNEKKIKYLVEKLEKQEAANKKKLTATELAILDAHLGMKKQGKEITARTIEEIRFMMD